MEQAVLQPETATSSDGANGSRPPACESLAAAAPPSTQLEDPPRRNTALPPEDAAAILALVDAPGSLSEAARTIPADRLLALLADPATQQALDHLRAFAAIRREFRADAHRDDLITALRDVARTTTDLVEKRLAASAALRSLDRGIAVRHPPRTGRGGSRGRNESGPQVRRGGTEGALSPTASPGLDRHLTSAASATTTSPAADTPSSSLRRSVAPSLPSVSQIMRDYRARVREHDQALRAIHDERRQREERLADLFRRATEAHPPRPGGGGSAGRSPDETEGALSPTAPTSLVAQSPSDDAARPRPPAHFERSPARPLANGIDATRGQRSETLPDFDGLLPRTHELTRSRAQVRFRSTDRTAPTPAARLAAAAGQAIAPDTG